MNIRDLKYLVALADHQHFGDAAKACFVTQPALSMQIAKLEKNLNMKLLERTQSGILLTESGRVVLSYAREILAQVHALQDYAKEASNPFSGEFELGIFPTLGPYLLPLIMPSLAKKFTHLKIYLLEEQTAQLVEKLKNGLIDAAILSLPIDESQLESLQLFDEEFVMAVAKTNPLSKSANVLPKDVKDQNILLLKDGHCMREQTLGICNILKTVENPQFRATSLETLRQMVIANVGITLIPKLAANADKRISYLEFRNPQPVRRIALFFRKTSGRKQLMKMFVSYIKQILENNTNINIV